VNSDFKNWCIAAVGTLGSIGLSTVNLVLSSMAALATFVFGCCKIVDWFEARQDKKRFNEKEI
jgi:hypothetical protein